MEFAIISGMAVLGSYLNKDKQPRTPRNLASTVAPNDIPSGNLVIENSMGQVVDDYILRKATQARSTVKADTNNVFPSASDDTAGWPAPLGVVQQTLENGGTGFDSASYQYEQNKSNLGRGMAPLDPQTGQIQMKNAAEVLSGPMFRQANFKGATEFLTQEDAKRMGVNISPLTGLPMDPTHANMQPHWTPGAHRTGVTDEMASSRLEQFTGVSEEYSTFSAKHETPATWNGPQDIKPAYITDATDTQSRAEVDLRASKDYLKPDGTDQRVTRMAPNEVEIRAKTMQEMFPSLNIQETAGRAGLSKANGGRADAPAMIYRRPQLDPTGRDAVGNRSIQTGFPVMQTPSVREGPSTEVQQTNWYGAKVSLQRDGNKESAHTAAINADDATVARRQEVYSPAWMTPDTVRAGKAPLQGTVIYRGTDKGIEKSYTTPADGSSGFISREGFTAPDATFKDTLDVSNHAGKYGMTSDGPTRGAYVNSTVDAPMTMKAVNSDAKYIAPGVRNRGFGIRQHGIQDWTTIKETLLAPYYGNAQSHVTAPASQEASWETATDRTQEVKYTMPVTNINEMGVSRCAEVDLKNEYNAARTEHGVVNSAENFECETVALREENIASGKRMYGNTKATRQDRPGIGLLNRVLVDNTAVNPRMDPSTVVTNDMFPFLNKKC